MPQLVFSINAKGFVQPATGHDTVIALDCPVNDKIPEHSSKKREALKNRLLSLLETAY